MTLLMQLTDVAGKGRLEPVTAAVNAGEILHLVGPNGAGKSTLLARMAGLTTGEGEITFLGQSLVDWLPATLASRRGYGSAAGSALCDARLALPDAASV